MREKGLDRKGIGRFFLFGAIVLAAGCVERRLIIFTEPPDAVVWLNDEEIGTTPVTVGFNWYGDYKVRIEKNGYQILNTHRDLPRPVEDYFPLDFFAEVIWPGTIRRDIAWTFTLQPAENPDSRDLLEQADEFKKQADRELQFARQKMQQEGTP